MNVIFYINHPIKSSISSILFLSFYLLWFHYELQLLVKGKPRKIKRILKFSTFGMSVDLTHLTFFF